MEETQSEANFATVEGIRLHFVEQGSGSPVVLLHGFASSLDVWNGVIPQLARRHRTVALDLKGFGASDRSAGDYSPRDQATLVWALLDHLGIREAALVGHSWGASVALAMALAAPQRTISIAL
jgi:pimeloyl-ACP methyl ester carboxylesterase